MYVRPGSVASDETKSAHAGAARVLRTDRAAAPIEAWRQH
jgi:hypothetical protein